MTGSGGRRDNLVDLADCIRELNEERTHSEYLEAVVVEKVVSRGGKERVRRTKQRRRHVVTLPGLLVALEEAAQPGSAVGAGGGGFESRPAAELEPLAVLTEIITDAGFWARTFNIDQPTLARTLSALVGAPHDDAQLAIITGQAARWVRRARLATGFDPAPFTISSRCPYCAAKNSITVTADLTAARCNRCGVDWTPDTIGLLSNMLTANQEHETLALTRCWQGDCTKYGDHDQHADGKGRTWGDTCPIPTSDGRISA